MNNKKQLTTISGHVGKDPQKRYTPQGNPVVSFQVAIRNNSFKPDWYRVNCVENPELADFTMRSIVKGMKVTVTGYLSISKWRDKVTGVQRNTTNIEATKIEKENSLAVKQYKDYLDNDRY